MLSSFSRETQVALSFDGTLSPRRGELEDYYACSACRVIIRLPAENFTWQESPPTLSSPPRRKVWAPPRGFSCWKNSLRRSIPIASETVRLLLAQRKTPLGSFLCALGRNRTCDLLDRNQTLYPLSYERDKTGRPEPESGTPSNMEHPFDRVNQIRFVLDLGDVMKQDVAYRIGIVVLERDMDS